MGVSLESVCPSSSKSLQENVLEKIQKLGVEFEFEFQRAVGLPTKKTLLSCCSAV